MKKNVRRILSFIVTMVMVLAIMPVFSFPMRAKAETEYRYNDFLYTVNEEGKITIILYDGLDTDIVIPAEIDKKPVVAVDETTFRENSLITSLTFEGNVGYIDYSAFRDFDALKIVTFKGNVGYIDDSAFFDCDNLTSVIFEGNVENIGKKAFQNCKKLTNVTFSGNVDNIGDYAFFYCIALTNVKGNIGNIGEYAFNDCNNLKSVIIEGNVGSIGEKAFYDCDNLTSVTFKGNVTSIGNEAFKYCNVLRSVILPQQTVIADDAFSTTKLYTYGFDSDTYTGQAISLKITDGDTVLEQGKDYTVTDNEIKSAGEYIVTITMIDPYSGQAEIKHTVKPLDLKTCDLILRESQEIYDGEDYKKRIIEELLLVRFNEYPISSENYDVYFQKEGETNWKQNIKEAGNYKVKFVSKGNNCTGEKIGYFTIYPKSIEDQSIKILPVSAHTYNGQEITPSVTVKDGNKELVKDQDYTVEYSNNTNVSRDESGNVIAGAKIKIKGIGNYDSEITESFTISPQALTITADSDTKCVGSTLIKESYTNTDLATGDRIESVTITGSQTNPGSSENVPSDAVIRNGAGEDVTSCYNISYVNGTLTVENHVFDLEVVTDKYLEEKADQTHAARYYYSCKCGETGTETFEAGEPLPTYTIIFDANGGSIEPVSADTNAEYKLDSLPTPEYDSYNFLGWFTNETGGDEITTDTVFGANMTIFAHWEKKEEPKPAQGGTEKPETPTEPSVPETPETPSEPETEDVKEETKSDYLDELYAMLREAIAKGDEQTITWSVGDSLPYDVMKILEENPQITLVFNYTYMGEDFNVTIRGRDVQADPKVKWCGPLYLYSIYGGYKGDENGLKESGTYIVQAGDTLSALAAKFNTTIKNLVALNNIKDENLIYIGQELRY